MTIEFYKSRKLKRIIKPGDTFEKLKIVSLFRISSLTAVHRTVANAVCECGNKIQINLDKIINGTKKSCGTCQKAERYKYCGRISDPSYSRFIYLTRNYANKLCDGWNPKVVGPEQALRNFSAWFQSQESKAGKLVLKDNKKEFSPENSVFKQKTYEYKGENKSALYFYKKYSPDITYLGFYNRLKSGMNVEEALSKRNQHRRIER